MNAAAFDAFGSELSGLAASAPRSTLSDAERVARAKEVIRRRVGAADAAYLETCLHCGMCAEACHFYVSTGDAKYTPIEKVAPLRRVYRREVGPMRWLFRLVSRDISAAQLESFQELVFDSCTECGRCDLICPMGIQISPMINVMREALTAAELAPAEFRAVEAEQAASRSDLGVGAAEITALAGRLTAEGVTVPVDAERADIIYFATALDVDLFPDSLKNAARIFNRLGESWTLLSASPQLIGSGESTAEVDVARIVEQARLRGATTLILPECGHAYPRLRFEAANVIGRELPFEVLTISEYIGRQLQDGRLKLKPLGGQGTVTYHDPCKIGRHGGVFEEPRAAIRALGLELVEMESHGRTGYCCGGGGGQFLIERAARLRQRAFEIKMREADDTGASSVITACNSCRYNFISGATRANWRTEVQSLVELVGSQLEDPQGVSP
jgi:Fe-S oxidoreductase